MKDPFARAYETAPPKERPPNWPIQSFDAHDWAEEFCRIAKEKGHDINEDWMVTWFACALMRGFDEHANRQRKELTS
jgi:hypothetical protein